MAGIREVYDSDCCDSCPYAPTCEEIRDFNRDVLRLGNPWGEEFEDFDDEAGWWPEDVDA